MESSLTCYPAGDVRLFGILEGQEFHQLINMPLHGYLITTCHEETKILKVREFYQSKF